MDEHGGRSLTVDEPAAMADWSRTVNQYAASVWHSARQSTSSPTRAVEISQLVWLRLELTTRNGRFPPDLERWLMQQVHDECARRRRDTRIRDNTCGSAHIQVVGGQNEA
jgi:DNA-directed RNA polymerase specialized sigma24 family protein